MKITSSIILALLLSTALIDIQASATGLDAVESFYGNTSVTASYDKTNSSIQLNINSARQPESALVVLTDRRGNIVFQDRAQIDSFGTDLEISMADLQKGIYFLRVKSKSIDFSGRYTKE